MKKYVPLVVLLISCFVSCKESGNKKEVNKTAFSKVELHNKSAAELRYIRNEIFARKGYVFKSKDLDAYFNKQSWYKPNPSASVILTDEEQAYVDKIKELESELEQKKALEIKNKEAQQNNPKKDSIAQITVKKTTANNESAVTHNNSEKRTQLETIDSSFIYSDNKGSYELLLTSNENNTSIYARCLKQDSITLKEEWKLRDFIINEANENEINFIKEVINVTDLDADGIVDPILVYATKVEDTYEEGRLKIIIRYNNAKIAIRHKNAILDDDRQTQIDSKFYALPIEIKIAVKKIMGTLMENRYALFNSSVLEDIDS